MQVFGKNAMTIVLLAETLHTRKTKIHAQHRLQMVQKTHLFLANIVYTNQATCVCLHKSVFVVQLTIMSQTDRDTLKVLCRSQYENR